MKHLLIATVLVLASPLASADLCVIGLCLGPAPAPAPPSSAPPAAAPEIDGAAGGLAIALVGGGLALLKRSRRPR